MEKVLVNVVNLLGKMQIKTKPLDKKVYGVYIRSGNCNRLLFKTRSKKVLKKVKNLVINKGSVIRFSLNNTLICRQMGYYTMFGVLCEPGDSTIVTHACKNKISVYGRMDIILSENKDWCLNMYPCYEPYWFYSYNYYDYDYTYVDSNGVIGENKWKGNIYISLIKEYGAKFIYRYENSKGDAVFI